MSDCFDHDITHTLSAEGHDASEDGTGRGAPLIAFQQNQRDEVRDLGDVAGALPAQPGMKQQNYIAFTCKDHGADAGSGTPPLRAMPHDTTWANGGGQVAVAFQLTGDRDDPGVSAYNDVYPTISANPMSDRQPAVAFTERTRADGRNFEAQEDIAYALTNPGSGGRTHSRQIITPAMAVRRLTPTECERLQGFPDGWTAVDGAADSTRYRQLGNAVAVPVAEWLARRILAAHPPRPAQADADSDERTQERG